MTNSENQSRVHYIAVECTSGNGDPEWSIEHPSDCPYNEACPGIIQYNCDVDQMVREAGLNAFGTYGEWPEQVPRLPGKYPIEAWYTKYYSYYYGSTEYDAGLQVIEKAEQ